jgi:transcriptional regulator with XRE-family HTH domain
MNRNYRLSSKLLIKLGRNIRKVRENKNKTQEQISLDAGIEMSYFSKIERGEANPSLEIIYAIIRALNIKSHEILPF